MKIRCWGARGSIPVSGSEYLRYGGDTTCIEIRNQNDDIIIIDCGSGVRRLAVGTAAASPVGAHTTGQGRQHPAQLARHLGLARPEARPDNRLGHMPP